MDLLIAEAENHIGAQPSPGLLRPLILEPDMDTVEDAPKRPTTTLNAEGSADA